MTKPPSDDTFFAELEVEIAAATAKGKLKADAANLKKTAHNMRLSPRQRAEAAAEFRALQAIVEANLWEAIAAGALFSEQTCDGCGSIHHTFLQFMQYERKVHDRSNGTRWVRVTLPMPGLPLETIIQPLTTHICSDCCQDHGFNVMAPTIKLMPRDEALTVSTTYIQGDINGTSEES